MAIANPNSQPAVVTFTVINGTGATVKADSRTIGPNSQVAGFLTESPYSIANGFQGTLSFTSTAPVGVIALRSLVNERSDFLITTLPVIDLSKSASIYSSRAAFRAVGDGWGTQIILVNPTDSVQTGTVQFFGPGSGNTAGAAVTVNVDGSPTTTASYCVARALHKNLWPQVRRPGSHTAQFELFLAVEAPRRRHWRFLDTNPRGLHCPKLVCRSFREQHFRCMWKRLTHREFSAASL